MVLLSVRIQFRPDRLNSFQYTKLVVKSVFILINGELDVINTELP